MPELTTEQVIALVLLFTRKKDHYENTYKWISTPVLDNDGVAVVKCWYDFEMKNGITIGITPHGSTHS